MIVNKVSIVVTIVTEDTQQSSASGTRPDESRLQLRIAEAEQEQDEIIDVLSELLDKFPELEGDYSIEHPYFRIEAR